LISVSNKQEDKHELTILTTTKYKQNIKNTYNIFEKIKYKKKKENNRSLNSSNSPENILTNYFNKNPKNNNKLINTKKNPIFTKLNSEKERQKRKNDLEHINKLLSLKKKIIIPTRNFFDTSMIYQPSNKEKKIIYKSFDKKEQLSNKQALNMSCPTDIVIDDKKILTSILTVETKKANTTLNDIVNAKKPHEDLIRNNIFALKSKFGIKKKNFNSNIGSVNTSVNSHSIDSFDVTTITNAVTNDQFKKKPDPLLKKKRTFFLKNIPKVGSKHNNIFINFKKQAASRSVDYSGNNANTPNAVSIGSEKSKSKNSSVDLFDDLKVYNGPFDIRCVSLINPIKLKEEVKKVLSLYSIKCESINGNNHKLVCTSGKMMFEVEIYKLIKTKEIYLVKFERITGNVGIYKEVCDKILIKLKL